MTTKAEEGALRAAVVHHARAVALTHPSRERGCEPWCALCELRQAVDRLEGARTAPCHRTARYGVRNLPTGALLDMSSGPSESLFDVREAGCHRVGVHEEHEATTPDGRTMRWRDMPRHDAIERMGADELQRRAGR